MDDSAIQFPLIKRHAKQGHEILKDAESLWPLTEMVYQYQEGMDGSGYPRRRDEEEIPTETRILSVADVVEAIVRIVRHWALTQF